MRGLIVAEYKKLTTTRATYLLLAGVIVVALVTVFDPGHDAATFERPFHEQTFVLYTALLTRILILIFGIRLVTDEFRHNTIIPTFLIAPRRAWVVVAKAVVVAIAGGLLGLAAAVAMTVAAGALAWSDGTTLTLGADAWRALGAMTAGGAMWGLIGLALGTLIRSQIIATVGGMAWLMAVEDAIKGSLGDLAGYLPGQAGLTLATGADASATLTGLVTMLAYATLLIVVSGFAIKRDVT